MYADNQVGWALVGALLVVGLLVAAGNAQTVEYKAAKAKPDGKLLPIDAALEGRVTIDFRNLPFDQAVAALRRAVGIDIRISRTIKDDLEVEAKAPISFRISGITLRSALKHLLAKLHPEATYYWANGVLKIASPYEVDRKGLQVRVYPVDDFFVPYEEPQQWIRQFYGNSFGWNYGSDLDQLIELIQFTRGDAWDEAGGPGSINEFDGFLIVKTTTQVHDHIRDVLRIVRQARNDKHKPDSRGILLASETCQTARHQILKALDRKLTFQYDKKPLFEVAADLQRRLKVPVLLDRAGLQEVGITLNASVKFHSEGVSAKSSLNQLLETINPTITFAINNEVLHITTREAAEEKLEYIAYPCADLVLPNAMLEGDCQILDPVLVRSQADFDALIEMIMVMVSPDSWPEGTYSGMREFEVPPLLIIEQTTEVHEEIAELLATLRKAKAERKKNQRPADHVAEADTTDADEYQIVVYHLNTKPRVAKKDGEAQPPPKDAAKTHEALVALIQELIDPSSWSSKETVMRVVNNRLVVRQKKSVHKKIEDLINALGNFPPQGGGGFF
jgi:hypothetical protein